MKQQIKKKSQSRWLALAVSAAITGASSFAFASDPAAAIDYSHLTDELIEETDGVAFNPAYYGVNGNGPALDADITEGDFKKMSLTSIRQIGVRMYTTPMRHADGHGDGPGINESNPTAPDLGPTGRPTLQGNGTWLRMNGLDSQTCLECHGVVDNSVVPAQLGVGGQAGIGGSPFFMTKNADIDDSVGNSTGDAGDDDEIGGALGIAAFDGRAINPPANFGLGGVELVGQEITATLQKIAAYASKYDKCLPLKAKGISFGTTCEPEGVDGDLEIRPFGRKGEFATVRGFDEGAMAFHIGMQNVNTFGPGDPDGDGISEELTNAQMRAFHVFMNTQERPVQTKAGYQAQLGFKLFNKVGCAGCHVPFLDTKSRFLKFTDPDSDDVYFKVDLSKGLTDFEKNRYGGIRVRMHSDFKRHAMGPRLQETAHFLDSPDCNETAGPEITNCTFITAKLWGVTDTSPYLHDGRALTLFEAVALHGGEAQEVRDRFLKSGKKTQDAIFAYLSTLKHPENPNQDVADQVQTGPTQSSRPSHGDHKKNHGDHKKNHGDHKKKYSYYKR